MKFVFSQTIEDRVELRVVETVVENVMWDDFEGRYVFEDEALVTVEKTVKRVAKTALADRTKKLAEQFDAVNMLDPDAVEAVLPPEPEEESEIEELDEDEDVEVDEAELDEQLLELGYSADVIDGFPVEEKVTRVYDRRPPDVAPSAVDVDVPVESHSWASGDAIRGYRLMAWRPTWPKAAGGRPRKYEVGESPDKTEIERCEKRWKAAGFMTQVVVLPVHPRSSKAKSTVWPDDPYEPIVCAVPGCDWVGDHLGPHLRKHGFRDASEYQTATGYRGPAVVGKASLALGQAHRAVKVRNDLRAGGFLVEVINTEELVTWKIVAPPSKSVDGIRLKRLGDEVEQLVKYDDLFKRFRPVGLWTRRLMRECGFEVRPARRIQRRRDG